MFAVFLFVVVFSFYCWLFTPEKQVSSPICATEDSIYLDEVYEEFTQTIEPEVSIPLVPSYQSEPITAIEAIKEDVNNNETRKAITEEFYKSKTVKELRAEASQRKFNNTLWKTMKKVDLVKLLATDDLNKITA
jgi:hypothetical protein